jgi:hypothetical protein
MAQEQPVTASGGFQEPMPPAFLMTRVHRLDLKPTLTGFCVGYECGRWRAEELASHMMEWLPEFALDYNERKAIQASNATRALRAAAQRVYKTDKFQKRGEFGELLLHIAMRQVFETLPAISKIYYKDSDNDTVKGFDAVHVVASEQALELWLGEVKFYEDISNAITDVVAELEKHTQPAYLKREFAAIINKIDAVWPYADRLKKLLDPNTSLDSVFDAICVPVLLTYDSDTINAHDRTNDSYCAQFQEEIEHHHRTFSQKALPPVRIHLFLVPLKEKQELLKALDAGLKTWQKI